MKKLMYILMLNIAVIGLTGYHAIAQTSGPRKPPTTRTYTQAPSDNERSATPASDSPAEAKTINGLEVILVEVNGSSANQTVTATLRMKNPSGNTDICTQQAYAVDVDGNQYQSLRGRECAPLFTDVPLKWTLGVKGIPAKIKNLALFTFGLYNKNTRKVEAVEFRNLIINWQ